VQDILMPPIGWMIGGVDFKDLKYVITPAVEAVAKTAEHPAVPAKPEVAILYGQCASIIIQFVIIAFTVFVIVKVMNRLIADRIIPPIDEQPPAK